MRFSSYRRKLFVFASKPVRRLASLQLSSAGRKRVSSLSNYLLSIESIDDKQDTPIDGKESVRYDDFVDCTFYGRIIGVWSEANEQDRKCGTDGIVPS